MVEEEKTTEEAQRLSWEESTQKMEQRARETEEMRFSFGDETEMVFIVSGVKPGIIEAIEALAGQNVKDVVRDMANEKQMQKQGIPVDLRSTTKEDPAHIVAIKDTYLEHGIVEGPPGFDQHNKAHLHRLTQPIRSALADKIDELSRLGIYVREGFR